MSHEPGVDKAAHGTGTRLTVSRAQPLRLLIVRLSSMGDVIHTLPLAANARRAGAEVGWVVERPYAGLLEGNPNVDRLFLADTKRWRRRPLASETLREMGELRRALRDFSPAFSIDAQGLWKSALLARTAGRATIGFAATSRREPASAVLCAIPVVPSADAAHVVDQNLALLGPAGIPADVRAPDASYLASLPSPEADAFLATLERPFVLFHPGAGRLEKAWGEERFAHVARGFIRERGVAPVVSWGPGDERRAERLRSLLPKRPPMPRLGFAGLARVIRASALFVAGDTGPLHLADALGARTLALFGPTDPARNGPYRNRTGVVTRMHEVSDDTVLARALEVWNEARRNP
jgi:lipopolysaccharide heptosyltransferase I